MKPIVYAVKIDELEEFIKKQFELEEACAMTHKNLVSGIELQAYHRAMEDVQIFVERMKFEVKQKKTKS